MPAGAEQQLNPDAANFRPSRAAATAVAAGIKEIVDDEETEQLTFKRVIPSELFHLTFYSFWNRLIVFFTSPK